MDALSTARRKFGRAEQKTAISQEKSEKQLRNIEKSRLRDIISLCVMSTHMEV